ncbi:centromere/kinetochore protein zw10 homolog [Homalodisca vitripennis]|uniref:centromere/kinetochore protein zw10 homolog n=1 Tax=Homalodisca vitripennis TaxID=197043 RepID=UPI001EEBF114|nr:centromere/kinetochore protein zw10 homolog [Homalodisca vitripennis]
MSFLEEILVSKGLVEVQELNVKIQELAKSIVVLKGEVIVAMEDIYVNYTSTLDDTNHLVNEVKNLETQLDHVTDCIDNKMKCELAASTDELENLSVTLKEATLSCNMVKQLLKIHTALDMSQNVNSGKILETAQQLKTVEEDLIRDNTFGLECLDIFEGIKKELVFERSKHSFNTVKLWLQSVSWDETIIENCRIVTLSLATNVDKQELLEALFYYDLLSMEMNKFGGRLFRDVLCPIISKVTRVDFKDKSTLALRIDLSGRAPPCIDVLNNLTIVLNFLSLQLNLKVDDETSFISELNKQISAEFISYLIKNCLSLTVPKKRDELEAYKVLVEDITAFEVFLKDIGFISEDDKSIAEYSTNVEELFAIKTCEAYLAAARNIMKKDIHDIKQVGPVSSNVPEELETTIHLTEVSPHTFQFPSCQISKSTDELLDLVNEILREIPKNTDMCVVKLFYTARNVFIMYCDVVPEFHERLLNTIPQQSAILHNNAMYLAHHLMFLGPKYQPSFPPVLQSHTTTFVDLVETLRSLAVSVFSKQLLMQKKHIIDILRDSGLVTLSDSPKFPEDIEKAIRQCLRQLALLQTVWQHVLPDNNYCKALGLLCNAFVEEIVQKVLSAEDIPADTAAQLVEVFSLIQQKAPLVFPEPQEIHRHVKKWAKFTELQLVLGAGLREVDDRWADGKGPLAQEFTADQVRHLVRALFQISDRRAILLAKII